MEASFNNQGLVNVSFLGRGIVVRGACQEGK